jgi:hypothetical protein
MRAAIRTKRAAFMAGASLLTLLFMGACVPASAPADNGGYTICDDTVANSNCPADTAPVVINNSI